MRMGWKLLCVLGALVMPLAANANSIDDAQWNAAYQQLLKRPSDVKLNKRYIDLSVARGDYESAIAPLERLSMQDPDNAGYVLQLGEMYHKLHSSAVANNYLQQVLAHPKATAAQKTRAQQLLE